MFSVRAFSSVLPILVTNALIRAVFELVSFRHIGVRIIRTHPENVAVLNASVTVDTVTLFVIINGNNTLRFILAQVITAFVVILLRNQNVAVLSRNFFFQSSKRVNFSICIQNPKHIAKFHQQIDIFLTKQFPWPADKFTIFQNVTVTIPK